MLRRYWNNLERLDDEQFLATREGKVTLAVTVALLVPALYVACVVLLQLDVILG